MTPKGLATLLALVTKEGSAVSKGELLATIWPDTAVEEANLSQNIYTLRKLITPATDGVDPIENIPRFGYRFALPITRKEFIAPDNSEPYLLEEEVISSAAPDTGTAAVFPPSQIDVGETSEMHPATGRVSVMHGAIALCACLVILLGLIYALHYRRHSETTGASSLYLAKPFTSNFAEDEVTAVALSADGNLVAYADMDGIMLRSVRGGSSHHIGNSNFRVIDHLSWFPDGVHLVVSGEDNATGAPQVYKFSVLGEPAILLKSEARIGVASPDGREVAFTSADGTKLFVGGSAGEGSRQVAVTAKGDRIAVLLWTGDAHDLILERRSDAEIPGSVPTSRAAYRNTVERIDVLTGQVTNSGTTPAFGDACITEDGRMLYTKVQPGSGREAQILQEVPISSSGAFGSPATTVFTAEDYSHMYSFSCSADGRSIAVIRQQGSVAAFIGKLKEGNLGLSDVKRLTYDSYAAYAHGWSADGRSVLYEAKRHEPTGDDRWQISSQALGSHDSHILLSMSGSQSRPVLTPDHQWLLFNSKTDANDREALFRVPSTGGAPVMVPSTEDLTQYRCPLLAGYCVVRIASSGKRVVYSFLDPVTGIGNTVFTEPSDGPPATDWDISPDGRNLVLVNASGTIAPLSIVSIATGIVHSVAFHPSANTLAVNWAANGKGFFVATATPLGSLLSYVTLAGISTPLRNTNGITWAVPSPDGQHLAFVDRASESNVWLLQRDHK